MFQRQDVLTPGSSNGRIMGLEPIDVGSNPAPGTMSHSDLEKRRRYHLEYMLKRYRLLKEEAIKILGGVCAVCGSKRKLEFDHIDPSKKSFAISGLWSISKVKRFRELRKCQLLCYRCHKAKTSSERPQTNFLCGTTSRYYQGCRCHLCKEAFNTYRREWRLRTGQTQKHRSVA